MLITQHVLVDDFAELTEASAHDVACKAQKSYHGHLLRELLRKYVDLLTTVLQIEAMTGVSYESHSRLMRL
jgi:hypothetical protein